MIISIISAIGRNNVIGDKNSLPWHLPADFKHFQNLTINKPIIMGSKTFMSIGRALPKRDNIVLTRNKDYNFKDCKIAFSVEQAIYLAQHSDMVKTNNEAMICGGASVYGQFLELADKMFLTFIDNDFIGDAFFPRFDKTKWKEIQRENHLADKNNKYNYSFVEFGRI